MLHSDRAWWLSPMNSVEELAKYLKGWTWPCCAGFYVNGTDYVFLNDSTNANSVQRYACCKRPDPYGPLVQVESITFSQCTEQQIRTYIADILAGKYDGQAGEKMYLAIETPQQHRQCHLCR